MAKILTDKEMLQVLSDAVKGDAIDDGDSYEHFLEDMGTLIADHFGGERGKVMVPKAVAFPLQQEEYTVAFHHNECVPDGGGEFAKYDTDISFEEWKADSKED